MPTEIEKDAVTGKDTTGHEWDGVKELNNPLPKWWLYVFYATIVYALAWFVLFPAIPYGTGYTKGLLGSTAREEVAESIDQAQAARAGRLSELKAIGLPELQDRPDLLAFAVQGGQSIFADNCAGCHALGGAGQSIYPTLADDDWLWGGTYDEIYHTIWHGVRNADEESRYSEMPVFGEILGRQEIRDVAAYVQSLSQNEAQTPQPETTPSDLADETDVKERVALTAENADPKAGAALFAENCAACHGENGGGDTAVGAPRLNDQIWLYGGTDEEIQAQIYAPRHGVMPAWGPRLGDVGVKMAAAYVYNLGGGRAAMEQAAAMEE